MTKPAAIVGQIILYGAFAAFIGYFSTSPTYRQIPDDVALIKLSMSQLCGRDCRKRRPQELQQLQPLGGEEVREITLERRGDHQARPETSPTTLPACFA